MFCLLGNMNEGPLELYIIASKGYLFQSVDNMRTSCQDSKECRNELHGCIVGLPSVFSFSYFSSSLKRF